MITQPKHDRVHRLVLEIEVARGSSSRSIERDFRQSFLDLGIPAIEELCAEHLDGQCEFRVDRLEIHLGRIVVDDIFETMAERVSEEFLKALRTLDSNERSPAFTDQESPGSSALEALGQFLKTGLWPWWCEGQNLEALLLAQLEMQPVAAVEMLKNGIANVGFRRRLCYQVQPSTISRILHVLLPGRADPVLRVRERVGRSLSSEGQKATIGALLDECLLRFAVGVTRPFRDSDVVAAMRTASAREPVVHAQIVQAYGEAGDELGTSAAPNEWEAASVPTDQATWSDGCALRPKSDGVSTAGEGANASTQSQATPSLESSDRHSDEFAKHPVDQTSLERSAAAEATNRGSANANRESVEEVADIVRRTDAPKWERNANTPVIEESATSRIPADESETCESKAGEDKDREESPRTTLTKGGSSDLPLGRSTTDVKSRSDDSESLVSAPFDLAESDTNREADSVSARLASERASQRSDDSDVRSDAERRKSTTKTSREKQNSATGEDNSGPNRHSPPADEKMLAANEQSPAADELSTPPLPHSDRAAEFETAHTEKCSTDLPDSDAVAAAGSPSKGVSLPQLSPTATEVNLKGDESSVERDANSSAVSPSDEVTTRGRDLSVDESASSSHSGPTDAGVGGEHDRERSADHERGRTEKTSLGESVASECSDRNLDPDQLFQQSLVDEIRDDRLSLAGLHAETEGGSNVGEAQDNAQPVDGLEDSESSVQREERPDASGFADSSTEVSEEHRVSIERPSASPRQPSPGESGSNQPSAESPQYMENVNPIGNSAASKSVQNSVAIGSTDSTSAATKVSAERVTKTDSRGEETPHGLGFPDSPKEVATNHRVAADRHAEGNAVGNTTHTRARKPLPDGFSVYTENAGLVLFWPYLRQFFQEIGLVSGQGFVDEAAAHRAIHFLYYLATGELGVAEHKLALPKLLCGVPLEEPSPFRVEMSEEEKAEAGQLIRAVLRNWRAVNNTSVAGFRTSFLIRHGKLSYDSEQPSWTLHVEEKSYDLIMSQLPWGIQVVRLPWMMEAIYVQW